MHVTLIFNVTLVLSFSDSSARIVKILSFLILSFGSWIRWNTCVLTQGFWFSLKNWGNIHLRGQSETLHERARVLSAHVSVSIEIRDLGQSNGFAKHQENFNNVYKWGLNRWIVWISLVILPYKSRCIVSLLLFCTSCLFLFWFDVILGA